MMKEKEILKEINDLFHYANQNAIIAFGDLKEEELTKIIAWNDNLKNELIDRLQLHSDETSPTTTFFTLSRLNEQKNLHFLFDALELLEQQGIEIKLIIAGDGDQRTELEKRARQFKKIKIEFLGMVEGDTKKDLLNNRAIFIQPSKFEGHSIVTLEVMAKKHPVILTDIPANDCYKKHIPMIGSIVQLGNTHDLAGAIRLAIDWDYDKKGEEAFKVAETYDWKKIAKRYEKIYKELV